MKQAEQVKIILKAYRELLTAVEIQKDMLKDMHDYINKRDKVIMEALKKISEKITE